MCSVNILPIQVDASQVISRQAWHKSKNVTGLELCGTDYYNITAT